MEIREFAFDLFNNRLKFNASKAKFLEKFSASCSFCVKSLILHAPKET
jgi:aerobic-type carbon monoxide dehydrogenase small subunit (CoxS/CutS family)